MSNRLTIYTTIRGKLHADDLRFSAAMTSWTDDYYVEEVKITFNNIRQGVMKHMMEILDEYIIMSYNTKPQNAVNIIIGEVNYADTLSHNVRSDAYTSIETHKGVWQGISYWDHESKNSKSAAFTDINIIESVLDKNQLFKGVCIHDWEGWKVLKE